MDSDESLESTDSETLHDDVPKSNACEAMSIESIQKCGVCKLFHENAHLSYCHDVAYTNCETNAADTMADQLKLVP